MKKIARGKYAYSEAEVRKLMLGYRISPNLRLSWRQLRQRVTLVPGWFPTSFDRYRRNGIGLLHLDVNLYQSYKDCLDYFEPKVAPGGVIHFDEYRNRTFVGATRAIEEYYGGPPPGIQAGEFWNRWFLVKP